MPFRTILAVIAPDHSDRDLKIAAELSRAEGAHLSVLVLGIAPPPPVGEYITAISSAWAEERQAGAERLDARAKEVSAWLAGEDIAADVTTEYPDIAWAGETVGRRARYADLTIVGPELASDGAFADEVVEGLLFHSGKPLLKVPGDSQPTLAPRRVVVGWDSRIEASRSIREAIGVLAGAEEVRLTLVDPVRDELHHGDEPGADAAAYLARHGAKVTIDRLPSENRSVAEVLCRHAQDTAAELIVMGAYGHSRLRERIFGGVTRSMLDNPPLPVFMAR